MNIHSASSVLVLLVSISTLGPAPARADYVGVEESTLSGDSFLQNFGTALAVTTDATRIAVGQPSYSNATAGHVLVWLRSGAVTTREVTLAPTDGEMGDGFGTSVAMSADGSRLFVGAPFDYVGPSSIGSVRVYARVGTSWGLEALLSLGADSTARFGSAVATNAAGTLLLVGAPGTSTVYVFEGAGSSWGAPSTLTSAAIGMNAQFGAAVALAADGSHAVVGAPRDPTGGTASGSVHLFARAGASWTEEASFSGTDFGYLGCATAIDADGTRALVGAYATHSATVYVRSGSSWTAEATLSTTAATSYGISVSLSADGSRALVGASSELYAGAAHELHRTGTSWADVATLARGGATTLAYGRAVAIAPDATRAVVGEIGIGGLVGHAYVYADVGYACTTGGDCVTGFCDDGICCDVDCGDDVRDCRACASAITEQVNGRCSPLSVAVAPTIACRPVAGVCDRAESCTPYQTTCPTDRFLSSICRTSTAPCDVAESCSGASANCPADALAPSGTTCRAPLAECDVAETCTGSSPSCPADVRATAGTVCRAAVDTCDVVESCDGASPSCPADAMSCEDAASEADAIVDQDADASELDAGGGPLDAAPPDVDASAPSADATVARDAGTDGGDAGDAGDVGPHDGSLGTDVSTTTEPRPADCGCRVGRGAPQSTSAVALVALAGLVLARRRRRSKSSAAAPRREPEPG